jgi:uncharacterized protein
MISIDANLLTYAYCTAAPENTKATQFISSLADSDNVAISEFILAEFYLLLRNPAVLAQPLTANQAVSVVQAYRQHPKWKICGYSPNSKLIHDEMWKQASQRSFARRRIYDVRTVLTLITFGVTEFATANVKDFEGCGFKKVWNPLLSKG